MLGSRICRGMLSQQTADQSRAILIRTALQAIRVATENQAQQLRAKRNQDKAIENLVARRRFT